MQPKGSGAFLGALRGLFHEARRDMTESPDNLPSAPYPKPTAQVEPYVDVLGTDLAIEFLLTFGGAPVYIPDNPGDKSELVALIGIEKTRALAAEKHRLQARVPLAKHWLIRCLRARGEPVLQIARTLRMSDVSVRRVLNQPNRRVTTWD